jgi:hypothetical protein
MYDSDGTRGQVWRILEKSAVPLTASQIAKQCGPEVGAMSVARLLTGLCNHGHVLTFRPRNGNATSRYILAQSAIRLLPDAYTVLVAWYAKHDPKLSDLLVSDWQHWQDGGLPQPSGE